MKHRRILFGLIICFVACSASAVWRPGLKFGTVSGKAKWTDLPATTTVEMGPSMALTTTGWGAEITYVYSGQMYFDGSTYNFAEAIDDGGALKIDGETLFTDSAWATVTNVTVTPSVGWHNIEIRLTNGSGGAGPNKKQGWTDIGFGYNTTGITDGQRANYTYPEDTGDGTFFRYDDGAVIVPLTVVGEPFAVGAPSPNYGVYSNVTAGTTYTLTAPPVFTNAAQTIVYHCIGWKLEVNDELLATNTDENVTNCTYACANATDVAVLTWKWEPDVFKLDLAVTGEGTVSAEVSHDETVYVPATPASGMKFWKWTGSAVTAADTYRSKVTPTMSAEQSLSLTANFYDPATTPRIVRYVKPTATGKKDGTSWDDAYGDITTAYNDVAANPSGGEVWLMEGRHTLDNAIAIVPNITIRGGFAGTETEAVEANPSIHVTILSPSNYKNGDQTWQDVDTTPMWAGDDKMTFVNPPVSGDDDMPFSAMYNGVLLAAFTQTDGGLIENNEICGVDFFYYANWVVKVAAENVSPLIFRSCRFLVCGWFQHSKEKIINVANTPIEMYDCEFRGCQNPVFLTTDTTDSPVTSNVFTRCTFYVCDANYNCIPVSAGITAENNAKITLKGCSFDRCRNTTRAADANQRSGAILLRNVPDTIIEETVISRCVASNQMFTAGLVFAGQTNSTITIRRSRFEKCRYSGRGMGGHTSSAAAIGIWGSAALNVSDTAFIGNSVIGSTSDKSCGSILGNAGSGTIRGNFSNCTFEDNVSVGTADYTNRFLFAVGYPHRRYISFANCVFNNNKCGYADTVDPEVLVRNPEFRRPDAANESQTYAFVNCVFSNDAADYTPFANDESLSWGDDLSFANCVSSSSTGWGNATTKTFRYGVLTNETHAPLRPCVSTNGVTAAHGIDGGSAYRRSGRPVYRSTDGDLYIYDTVYNAAKPWRLLCSPDTVRTAEEGSALGLSLDAPIPDAFGYPRETNKIALGPLEWNVPGLILIVR